MIISEITIDNKRDIDSIKINYSLIDYLNKEGMSIEGMPSSTIRRNLGFTNIDLDIEI